MKHSPHFCNHKIAKIKTRIGVLNCWNASRLIFDKNHEQGYLVSFQYDRSLYYLVFRHLQIQTMKLIPAVEIINRRALFAEISTYRVTCKISRRTISLRGNKKYFILIWSNENLVWSNRYRTLFEKRTLFKAVLKSIWARRLSNKVSKNCHKQRCQAAISWTLVTLL